MDVFVPSDCTQRLVNVPSEEGFDVEFGTGYMPAKPIEKKASHKYPSYHLEWEDMDVESQVSFPRSPEDYDSQRLEDIGLEELNHPNEASICHVLRKKFRLGVYHSTVGRSHLFLRHHADNIRRSELELMKICHTYANKDDKQKRETGRISPLCEANFVAQGILRHLDLEKKSQAVCFGGRRGTGKSELFNACLAYLVYDNHGQFSEGAANVFRNSTSAFKAYFPPSPIGKSVVASLHLIYAFTEVQVDSEATSTRTLRAARVYYSSTSSGSRVGISRVELDAPLLDPNLVKIKHPAPGPGAAASGTEHPYHLLTMFCAHLSLHPDGPELLERYRLKDSILKANMDKAITRQQKEAKAEDFVALQTALLAGGVTTQQFEQLQATLAALLNLMAVGIVGNDSAIISGTSKGYLANAEQLLGLAQGSLLLLLTKRMDLGAKAPLEGQQGYGSIDHLFSQAPHRSVDSRGVLDYLVFELYQRAYTYLTKRIRAFARDRQEGGGGKTGSGAEAGAEAEAEAELMVSLVDGASAPSAPIRDDAAVPLAGLTASEACSYAQLLITYACEKVRATAIGRIFSDTIDGYKREGVVLDLGGKISKEDGDMSRYLDFFDAKTGSDVSHAVAEVAFAPRGDDKSVADKIYSSCKSDILKLTGQRAGDKSFRASAFTLAHSFGTIRYVADNLCAITRASALFHATMPGFALLDSSEVPLVKEGVALSANQKLTALGRKMGAEGAGGPPTGASAAGGAGAGAGVGRLKIAANTTLGKQFLQKFGHLSTCINKVDAAIAQAFASASVTYVMCMRANHLPGRAEEVTGKWQPALVAHQVRNMVVTDMAILGAASYPISRKIVDVYKKLRSVLPFNDPDFAYVVGNDARVVTADMIHAIVDRVLGPAMKDYNLSHAKDTGQRIKLPVMGRSAMFMFKPFAALMDRVVAEVLSRQDASARMIQKHVLGMMARRTWLMVRKAVVRLQTHYRMSVERRGYVVFLRSCRKLMATLMMMLQRAKYRIMKRAINRIKPWFRRKLTRLKYIHLLIQTRTMRSLVRGAVLGKRSGEVMSKVCVIQRQSRVLIGRIRHRRYCNSSATHIQRVYRGWLCREYHSSLVQRLRSSRHYRATTRLAVKLQALVRGMQVRLRAQSVHEKVCFLQRWLRSRKVHVDFMCVKYLTLWLQSQCRKMMAVNRVCGLMNTKLMLEDALAVGKARNKELLFSCHCPQNSLRLGTRPHVKGHLVVSTYAMAVLVENAHVHEAYPEGWMSMLVEHSHRLWNDYGAKKSIKHVALGYTHTVIVDDSSGVWSVGMGDGGQLGNGDRISHTKPVLMDRLMGLVAEDEAMIRSNGAAARRAGPSRNVFATHNISVKSVCCGRDHTMLLTGGGRVWSWGGNAKGQLGHSMFESSATPRLVGCHQPASSANSFNPILKSHLGDTKSHHSHHRHGHGHGHGHGEEVKAALEGSVFSGKKLIESVYVPFKNVKAIACGSYHSVALSDSGLLYTWGASWSLGRPAVRDMHPEMGPAVGADDPDSAASESKSLNKKASRKERRRRREELKDIAKQRVKKALEQGHDCEPAAPPAFHAAGVRMPVASVACGENHTIVKMAATVRNIRTGVELYSWGNNACGQCGIGPRDIVTQPQRRRSTFFGISVDAGDTTSVNPSADVVREPRRVKLPTLVSEMVTAQSQGGASPSSRFEGLHLGTISEGPSLKGSDRRRGAEQAKGDAPALLYNEQDMSAAVISAGARHTLMALKGDVWAWGSNDHGQLGDGTFVDSWEPRRVWRHVTVMGSVPATATSTAAAAKEPTGRYPGGNGQQYLTVQFAPGPDGPRSHKMVSGPYVKSVKAGYVTSYAATYSSRNLVALAQQASSAKYGESKRTSSTGVILPAKADDDDDLPDVASAAAGYRGSGSSRAFVWGRGPAEPEVPLLGNNTNNHLGRVPDMSRNPGPRVLGTAAKVEAGSTTGRKVVASAASAFSSPAASSSAASSLFGISEDSPESDQRSQHGADSALASPPPPQASLPARKPTRRRQSLLEMTRHTDVPVDPSVLTGAGKATGPSSTHEEIAFLRVDGTPNLPLPTEVEPPVISPSERQALGLSEDPLHEGGRIADVTDIGIITSACPSLCLLTYECEELPRDTFGVKATKEKPAWKVEASVLRSGGDGDGESKDKDKDKDKERPPSPQKLRVSSKHKWKTPSEAVNEGEGGRIAESEWQSSPDRFSGYDSWLGSSGSSTAAARSDFRGGAPQRNRPPSPKRKPLPPWHDESSKRGPMAMISFAPDQVAINQKMRELAQTSTFIPGVASLSERMFADGKNLDGTAIEDDASSTAGSDSSHASYATTNTYTSGISTDSAIKRRVRRHLARERTMRTATIRGREKKIPQDALVALFAPHVAKNHSRDAVDMRDGKTSKSARGKKGEKRRTAAAVSAGRRKSVMFASSDGEKNGVKENEGDDDDDDGDDDDDDDDGSDYASSEEDDLFGGQKRRNYQFAGDTHEAAAMKAEAALEIDKLSAEIISTHLKPGTPVSNAFEGLVERRASLRQGQAIISGLGDPTDDDDLSARTAIDGRFLGARSPSPSSLTKGKFSPGKIPFGSDAAHSSTGGRGSPSSSAARPGSPLKLSVVRDVHTTISELKQKEMTSVGRLMKVRDRQSEGDGV